MDDNPYVTSTIIDTNKGLQVSAMIQRNRRQLDIPQLIALFTNNVAKILALPLLNRYQDYMWVWKNDSKGHFSVKSAYKLLHPEPIDRLGNVSWSRL